MILPSAQIVGFTMIEVVIAFALATVLVVSVYSTTMAMNGTAARQKALSVEFVKWSRFEEILRRDLRGWVNGKQGANFSSTKTAPTDQALLSFDSTSDSFSSGENALQTRSQTKLQYLLFPVEGGYVIQRSESTAGSNTIIPVFKCSQIPKTEFFDGANWSDQWTKKERPKCVRITAGKQLCVWLP